MIGDLPNEVLKGQVALVTGGSRGIGQSIAIHLARAGAAVAVTARDRSALKETLRLIDAEGGKAMGYALEVRDGKAVRSVAELIFRELGPLDLLVNNAGILVPETCPWDTDAEEWWRVLEVNVKGVFLCTQAVLPGMIKRGSGRVINLGSNAAIHPFPSSSAYSLSKVALMRMTDTFAEAASEKGVYLFAMAPGMVRTDMTRAIPALQDVPDSAWTPIEKSAELCVYLASGRADILTGRYVNAREDDIEVMVKDAERIIERDLHVLRLRR